MVFHVEITRSASADAEEYSTYIKQERHDPVGSERWWNGLVDVLATLEYQPARCALARERLLASRGVRQLLYYSHRILFLVDEGRATVHVLRIHHAARRGLRLQDVFIDPLLQ